MEGWSFKIDSDSVFKILMCSRPGGDRGPGLTFGHHVKALNTDNRFEVDELWKIQSPRLSDSWKYDIFWFYAKGFDPQMYKMLKKSFPSKKFVFGPNVLLDKPDIGAADEWDKWFVSEVEFDLYIDQVEYYNNHVKKFLRKDLLDRADFLDKCVTFDINEEIIHNKDIQYDCLVYSKKRRYDLNYEKFHGDIISLLEQNNVSFLEITYAKYKRQDYFDGLLKSKCCLNLSLDECPGIATYESMFLDVPIIGSPHNTPSIFDKNFWVHDTDHMTEKYLVRNENAAISYIDKLNDFLNGDLVPSISPRDYILKHAGYARYSEDAFRLLNKYCS